MHQRTRFIIYLIVAMLLAAFTVCGQTGFFIPPKAKIFFNGDTATIFSDVINRGQLGIGSKAVVNFKGLQWENDPLAIISNESNNGDGVTGPGGITRFLLPDSSMWPSVSRQQFLVGGYNAAAHTGATFANLQVSNRYGVQLSGSNARIRNNLHFTDGHIYTGNNILVLGDSSPGIITGYNEDRFIVTGTSASGGFLIREQVRSTDGPVTFPVGSSNQTYTPLSIYSKSAVPDNFYAGVFDGVKTNIVTGASLNENSVNKTWQVGKLLRPNQDEVEITLQHLLAEEGKTEFMPNRANTYVSQYSNGKWDVSYPQSAPVSPGNLTTDSWLTNSGTNVRSFTASVGLVSYFSKFTSPVSGVNKANLWFNAYRINPDLVRVYWKTNPEINIQYFVVQRRLSNEANFKNIDTVSSQAVGGFSLRDLWYSIIDPNPYRGISFYRLMPVTYNHDTSYSQIVAVGGSPGKYRLTLWPNPTPDHFYIGLNGEVFVKSIIIWNAIGQTIRVEPVNGRRIIEMHGLIPGTYMVGFISTTGDIVETKKLVVVGY